MVVVVMKNCICITGLAGKFTENITKKLAKELDLYYANVINMLEFDIIDIRNTINICGLDYYKKLVAKKLKELTTYENDIVYLNYYILQYSECRPVIREKFITIYLDLPEQRYAKLIEDENLTELEAKLEKGVYKPRNKHFSSICDIIVKCKNKSETDIVNSIKKEIINYYKKVERYENRSKSGK